MELFSGLWMALRCLVMYGPDSDELNFTKFIDQGFHCVCSATFDLADLYTLTFFSNSTHPIIEATSFVTLTLKCLMR